MTREEHRALGKEHAEKGTVALHRFIETHDTKDWEEYLMESKLANKHHGIANAMWTKEMKKREKGMWR